MKTEAELMASSLKKTGWTIELSSLPISVDELRRELVYIQAHLNEASRYVMGPEVRPQVNAARARIINILGLLK
jgi:hypothetical protein